MANVDYGIQEITFCKLGPGGAFPDFEAAPDEDKISIQMIDIDSYEPTEEENQTTDVEFENADTLTLPGTKGKKKIAFSSSDKSDKALQFFKGMKKGTGDNEGWVVEDPDHDGSGTYAMQVKTRAIEPYPAKIKQYTPVLVTVKETGVTGKNNLGKLSYTCDRQPNFDSKGDPTAGYREKAIETV